MLICLNDVIIIGTCIKTITTVKQAIHKKFTIKNLGYMKYILGLEVARSFESIISNEKKFIFYVVVGTGLSNYKLVVCPLP